MEAIATALLSPQSGSLVMAFHHTLSHTVVPLFPVCICFPWSLSDGKGKAYISPVYIRFCGAYLAQAGQGRGQESEEQRGG